MTTNPPSQQRILELVDAGDFRRLFVEELGWSNPDGRHIITVTVDGEQHTLTQAASFKGLRVWYCNSLPTSRVQRLIDVELAKDSAERLVIFASKHTQDWRWPRRAESGRGTRLIVHPHFVGTENIALASRLQEVALDFENDTSLIELLARMRVAFDAEQVTTRFYRQYETRHKALVQAIVGLPTWNGDDGVPVAQRNPERQWYAALTMNRLMFVYFMQRKGFMASDANYLRNRLDRLQNLPGRPYTFYRDFLIPLFQQGLGEPHPQVSDQVIKDLLGDVAYINGGIFTEHELERSFGIDIPDDQFQAIFDLFDGYQWVLDDREGGSPHEINPDVLGYIFEQFINQKQMGAYYTREDVTHYMTSATLLPVVLTRLEALGVDVWAPLAADPERYIWDGVRHGEGITFPADIEAQRACYRRPDWLAAPSSDIAHPGETWWEVDHRRSELQHLRTRMAAGEITTADDAFTENLNLEQLALDLIDHLDTPESILGTWRLLSELRIIDPTCGSGAFLFAALRLLLPLYSATLDAARAIEGEGDGAITDLLSQVRPPRHPNEQYFLLKHASLSNLYGVDIMKEAVEIARLRLFLRLVAAIDPGDIVEPLPDLDFNIKAGNALVGALTADDITAASGDLLSMATEDPVLESARRVGTAYSAFRAAQEDGNESGIKRTRDALRRLLDEVRVDVDAQYYATATHPTTLSRWRETHHPFHWFIEFPEVFDRGGFDVVVGNPPYIQKREIAEYEFSGFKCDNLPDIYAACTERSTQITAQQGRFSLIVPISGQFSDDYRILRELLEHRFGVIWVSTFERRPSTLFPGGKVGVRSTIVVGAAGNKYTRRLFMTNTCRWVREYRPHLFECMRFVERSSSLATPSAWMRLPSVEVHQFYELLAEKYPLRLSRLFVRSSSSHRFGFKGNALYYLSAFTVAPRVVEPDGSEGTPSMMRWVTTGSENDKHAALALSLSKTMMVWWFLTSDNLNVTLGVIGTLPFDPTLLDSETRSRLVELGRQLEAVLPSTSRSVIYR